MFHASRLFVACLFGAWLALAPACTKNEPSAPASTPAQAEQASAPAPAATPAAPASAEPSASSPATPEKPESPAVAGTTTRQLNLDNKPWTGDFDAMRERRMIRALVPYSRTLYFTDKGRERGLSAELLRDFERYLNQKYAKSLGKRPITVYLIPTTRDRLLPDLAAGLGDIAAGNLTETPARLKLVDFVTPRDRKPVRELLVTGPQSAPVTRLEDLAGRRVHVRPATELLRKRPCAQRETGARRQAGHPDRAVAGRAGGRGHPRDAQRRPARVCRRRRLEGAHLGAGVARHPGA